jgi:hypothetical protein
MISNGVLNILLIGVFGVGALSSYLVMHYWFGCRKHPIHEPDGSPADASLEEQINDVCDMHTLKILTNLSYLLESHRHARISAEDTLRVIQQETRMRLTSLEAKHPESLLAESTPDPFSPFSVA